MIGILVVVLVAAIVYILLAALTHVGVLALVAALLVLVVGLASGVRGL